MATRAQAPDLARFAQRLRAARQAAGLTQRELAEQAGLTHRSVCGWEHCYREPGVLAAAQLARTLGVTVDALAGLGPPAAKGRGKGGAK